MRRGAAAGAASELTASKPVAVIRGSTKPCKLIAIDLDGTTVEDNEEWGEDERLPAGTVEAAIAYQEAGGHLVIATGRGYHGARGVAAQLRCEQYAGLMVCGNGATVHDLRSGDPSKSIMYRETLRADTFSCLYRILLRANPALQFGVNLAEGNAMMHNNT